MEHTHAHLVANSSQSWSPGSACGLGFVPVVYYSLLLCLGLPGEGRGGEGGKPGAQRVRGEPCSGSPGLATFSVRSLAPSLQKVYAFPGNCGHFQTLGGERKLRWPGRDGACVCVCVSRVCAVGDGPGCVWGRCERARFELLGVYLCARLKGSVRRP